MTLSQQLNSEITEQKLPSDFIKTVDRCYVPIAANIAKLVSKQSDSYVIGVQGCQGSGKSTLASFLKVLLESKFKIRTTVLSIDDFYLCKHEREALAANVHPLLATRGVPGTHDVSMAVEAIEQLTSLKDNDVYAVPRFDKSIDDRAAADSWSRIEGKQQVVILEGWCVGLGAQADDELADHRNELEEQEDEELLWRRYVNDMLKGPYQKLFNKLQKLVVLKAPSFDCVYRWRSLQEMKLIKKISTHRHVHDDTRQIHTMNAQQIRRFISHYQRLTEHSLATLPEKADWLLLIDEDHSITLCDKQ